jgi:callose synthase
MDTQIWYAIFSTLFGGIHGAFSHLGEIRTLGMLRSRFESIPIAFSRTLMPSEDAKRKHADDYVDQKNITNFSQVWNEFIYSMRSEDKISDRDRDLLLVPSSSGDVSVIQWPPFLLASKIPIAVDMAKDFKGKEDAELFRKIKSDSYMYYAVIESYETLKKIIYALLEDEADRRYTRFMLLFQWWKYFVLYNIMHLEPCFIDSFNFSLLNKGHESGIFRSGHEHAATEIHI